MAESHYLKVEKTARYFLSSDPQRRYHGVCFVLHGYGQLAEYFIRPFQKAKIQDILFVAPEGLHRFYLKGSEGRVGASWMTREDRLSDIEDYCTYLDQLRNHLLPQLELADKKNVGVLGFSQGVATACRWLSYSRYRFRYLVNYAGIYPPDLPEEQALEKMQQIPVRHMLGRDDEYISEQRMRESLGEFAKRGYPSDLQLFKGKHRLYPEVLKDLFAEILAMN